MDKEMMGVFCSAAAKATNVGATTETGGQGRVGRKLTGPSIQLDNSRKGRRGASVRVRRWRNAIMKKGGQSVKWSERSIVERTGGKKGVKKGRKVSINERMGR